MTNDHPEGYLAIPRTGTGPGILVLHSWWGLNPFFKDLCKRLARAGFTSFAPDLYHSELATTIPEAELLRDKLNKKQLEQDLRQAITYLKGMETVSSSSLGVIGFSLGAFFALGISREHPQEIGAVVCFYGTRGGAYTSAQAAYLGHYAESDEWESPTSIKQLERHLHAAHRPVTFHTYPGTGHWFFEKDRTEAYNAKAADLAWKRTLEFLRETLSP